MCGSSDPCCNTHHDRTGRPDAPHAKQDHQPTRPKPPEDRHTPCRARGAATPRAGCASPGKARSGLPSDHRDLARQHTLAARARPPGYGRSGMPNPRDARLADCVDPRDAGHSERDQRGRASAAGTNAAAPGALRMGGRRRCDRSRVGKTARVALPTHRSGPPPPDPAFARARIVSIIRGQPARPVGKLPAGPRRSDARECAPRLSPSLSRPSSSAGGVRGAHRIARVVRYS